MKESEPYLYSGMSFWPHPLPPLGLWNCQKFLRISCVFKLIFDRCAWIAVFLWNFNWFCKFEKFACYYNPIVWICILKNKVIYLMYCITLTTNPAQCKCLFWHSKVHFKTKIYLFLKFNLVDFLVRTLRCTYKIFIFVNEKNTLKSMIL